MLTINKTLLCMTALLMLGACSPNAQELNQANVAKAVNDYLAVRGNLCLAKSAWPIDVAEAEGQSGSRNALQMPALEKLGLVAGADANADKTDENGVKTTLKVRRYNLTEAGRKYYLARAPHKYPTGNRFAEADHDFCAAKLTLDTVVGWESVSHPDQPGGPAETVVTYTYKIAPAPWTDDAGVRAAFPMVDTIIRGAGGLQLKETFVLTGGGWEAKDL